ncbi:hypothetical protein DYH09_35755 [bacterium CPR1]|nr:hypothetical protein [bacterium CPR1]
MLLGFFTILTQDIGLRGRLGGGVDTWPGHRIPDKLAGQDPVIVPQYEHTIPRGRVALEHLAEQPLRNARKVLVTVTTDEAGPSLAAPVDVLDVPGPFLGAGPDGPKDQRHVTGISIQRAVIPAARIVPVNLADRLHPELHTPLLGVHHVDDPDPAEEQQLAVRVQMRFDGRSDLVLECRPPERAVEHQVKGLLLAQLVERQDGWG